MNTTQVTAASFNLFTEANLPTTHVQYLNERFKEGYQGKEAAKNRELYDSLGLEIYYECRQEVSQGETIYYIEHYYAIKVSDKGVLCMLKEYKGKFYFHPYYGYERGLSYGQKREFFTAPKEPNMIGVFSAKKVNDWVSYCEQYVEAIEEAKTKVNEKTNAGQDRLNKFLSYLPKNAEVKNSGRNTWVSTNNFHIAFTLTETGYLSTNIDYRGNIEDLSKLLNSIK